MAANPFGAHQAGRHRAGRGGGRSATALVAGHFPRQRQIQDLNPVAATQLSGSLSGRPRPPPRPQARSPLPSITPARVRRVASPTVSEDPLSLPPAPARLRRAVFPAASSPREKESPAGTGAAGGRFPGEGVGRRSCTRTRGETHHVDRPDVPSRRADLSGSSIRARPRRRALRGRKVSLASRRGDSSRSG